MSDGLKPPQSFNVTTESAKEWPQWKDHFTFYLRATKKNKEDGPTQVAILLTAMGREAIPIYKTFTWTAEGDNDKLDKVLEAFTTYFRPKTNETYERFIFLQRRQQPGEPFDAFYSDLLRLAETCCYHVEEKPKIVRDQIVINVLSDVIREKLLTEATLTLDKAADICRSMEATTHYLSSMSSSEPVAVHAIRRSKSTGCQYCGLQHKPRSCPAWGKTCGYCGKPNHSSEVCKQAERDKRLGSDKHTSREAKREKPQQATSQVFQTAKKETAAAVVPSPAQPSNPQTDSPPDHFAYAVGQPETRDGSTEWNIILDIGGRGLRTKVDTGASCNILPLAAYETLFSQPPQPTDIQLTAYGGSKLDVCGKAITWATHHGKKRQIEFIVVQENVQALLGLPSIKSFGLLQAAHLVTTSGVPAMIAPWEDVFQGLGRLPGEHHIQLRSDAQPVIQPARRVPIKYRDQLQQQLQEMEQEGIITPVHEATAWVSPIVLVNKPDTNKLRICMDPGALNRAIQREHYQLKTPEEIFSSLAGSTYFSTLDATSGFLQLALDEQSSYLTTIATPFGRYRYLRLPFGISSAPEVFHRTTTETFMDIPGVYVYVDDILVAGATEKEHDARLSQVLQRCREINLKLNLSKCQFKMQELRYLGHILSTDGIKPDPTKVEAIRNFPTPANKSDVSRLLGLVTYLSKFCPDLAERVQTLRTLTHKDVPWTWDENHSHALETVKTMVTDAPILGLFNSELPITVSVDASNHGLGAALFQDGQPVEYASRTLSASQTRYAQIEKEMLAIQFGLERFHQYVYGQQVIVETDHKPLLGIMKKPIAEVSPRLQRMRLRCLRYDFTLEYKQARELILADALSRAPVDELYEDHDHKTEDQIASVILQTMPTSLGRQRCLEATAQDPTSQATLAFIRSGWPDSKKALPTAVKPYWNVRHDLTEKEGIILKGCQAVVPTTLRNKVMASIHEGHGGIVKSIERAKTTVYWPGYINDLKDMVESCSKCQEHRRANPQLPPHPHEVPEYPFQKIGTDLFELEGIKYLLTVDYFSRWPTLDRLDNTRTSDVMQALNRQFANYGIPETLFSDNGPQFANREFREFTRSLGVSHVTSSPHHPASNGLAERHVQTAKNTMIKMMDDRHNINDVLRVLRSTPIGSGLPSPAVLLQGRQLRTKIAIDSDAFLPSPYDLKTIRTKLLQLQAQQAYNSAAATVTPSPLYAGDKIRIRHNKRWEPAEIVEHAQTPHSYMVRIPSGRILRRTRAHINKTSETWTTNPILNTGPGAESRTSSIPTGVKCDETPDDRITTNAAETTIKLSPQASHTTSAEPQHIPMTATTHTRSGRVSRPPRHLTEDYVV